MSKPLEYSSSAVGAASAALAPHDTGIFAALRIQSFRRLWLGSTVVFLGVMAQSIARSWLAFDLTGSNAALGGVLLSFGLAMVLATPLGGVVGDRWPKRTVLQISIGLLAVTSAWIGFAVTFHFIAYWMLLVAGALQAVAFAMYNPSRMAFIGELVPARGFSEAVTLMLINAEGSRVAGPALAGVAIATLSYGVQVVFLTCAALFVAGLLAGATLPPGRSRATGPPQSPWAELVEGLRYVKVRRPVLLLLVCSLVVVMVGLPYLAFLPTVAADLFHAGSAGYGVLSACSAVGAVVSGLFIGRLRRRFGPWAVLVGSGVAFGLALVAFAVAPSFVLAAVLLVPLGAGLLAFQTLTQSLLLSLSSLEYHGRIQGLVMLSFGGFGIMALPLGVLADAVGLRVTFAAMGASVLLTLAVFTYASRRHWDETRLLELG